MMKEKWYGSQGGATVKLIIPGNVPSQKNRKIISMNRATKRPFLRTAPQVKLWQDEALIHLTKQFKGYQMTEYPITITMVFFFDNLRRHDLDNALSTVMDALVAAKVIEDDNANFVECITIQYGGHDKINPRVEIYFDE